MAKMRLLTFMGMAVEFKEISFDTMQQELQIGADDVEAFVIDGTSTSPQINLNRLPLLSMLLVFQNWQMGWKKRKWLNSGH